MRFVGPGSAPPLNLTRLWLHNTLQTIFEDHLVRDINAGRFSKNTSLVLVTHGLALRIFLMRCSTAKLCRLPVAHHPAAACIQHWRQFSA